ncbi:MAG: GNAT family N-acetyltransferase [Eubacteriales bacterium]|nr:GNAT family N-acetyltransferase [Eubacteriales bacterium]
MKKLVIGTDNNIDKNILEKLSEAGFDLEIVPELNKSDIGIGENYRGNAGYVLYFAEDLTPEYCQHVLNRKLGRPDTILETDRCIVREESMGDLDELYKLYDSLKDCPFVEKLYERDEEEEFTRNYIDNMYRFFDYGLWLVFDKATGQLVGRIGIENRDIDGQICQELGYLIGQKFQRKHIGYEVCKAIMSYARDNLGIKRLYSCIDKNNIPSIGLIEKLGFSLYDSDIDGINIYYIDLQIK